VKIEDGAITTSTYDAANHGYDGAGNQQTIEKPDSTVTTNTWSYENQITQVENESGVIQSAQYNADNKRVEKVAEGATTKYLYDGLAYLGETDENDDLKATFTNEPTTYGALISQYRKSNGVWLPSYYHHDALGSMRELTDAAETKTDEYLNTAWGVPVLATGPTENYCIWLGLWGYVFDPATGTFHVRERDYRPTIARWVCPDPERFIDGPNLYWYSINRPLNALDPTGRDFIALAHFRVARGRRGIGFVTLGFHYSLQHWVCCPDTPADFEMIGLLIELHSWNWRTGESSALPRPPRIQHCVPVSWVELGGFDWIADGGAVDIATDLYGNYSASIAEITYDRPDHGPIEAIVPLAVGYNEDITARWNSIILTAQMYEWAEQQGFGGEYKKWPRSLYWWQGTNSKTFIYQMVRRAGLPWFDMPGAHPGELVPSQNPVTNPATFTPYTDRDGNLLHLVPDYVTPPANTRRR
jgi:RHS repeat-associated protein